MKALRDRSTSSAHCAGAACDQTGLSAFQDAKSAALIADVGFALGAVGLGVAGYLFFTSRSEAPVRPTHGQRRVRRAASLHERDPVDRGT